MPANMTVLKIVVQFILAFLYYLDTLIPKRRGFIPEPGFLLSSLLETLYPNNKLYQLEALTDFYNRYGLFRFENKIYIFNPKLTQTVINKLEKGAKNYLIDSPLKETFLGSSSRSPEVRRAIASIFRRNTLEEKGTLIIKDVETMCEHMGTQAETGEPVNLTEWSLKMAMDAVGHMLLQLDLYALEGQQDELLQCLLTILHRCYALGEISPASAEFKQANGQFEKLTADILTNALHKEDNSVEKRLVVKLHEACGFEQGIWLHVPRLQKISTEKKSRVIFLADEARDNMKLFLMAGSETTASTIPVLFYLLASHPHVQDELRQEADENMEGLYTDPAMELPKTEAVIREVLRVYPIAPFISRHTSEELVVGEVKIPANSDIKAFTWGIHRSPSQWCQSKHFVPFRFLGSDQPTSSLYIPFGAGSRICIGQHLAMLELKIATAILLRRFIFSKVPETPDLMFVTDWQHAVVHPDKDMLFKLTPRNI